jgi:hypothetical protein
MPDLALRRRDAEEVAPVRDAEATRVQDAERRSLAELTMPEGCGTAAGTRVRKFWFTTAAR